MPVPGSHLGTPVGGDSKKTKETAHIISKTCPEGEDIELLGLTFDMQLTMSNEISALVGECSWKLHSIVRSRRFFTDVELVSHYKSHVLSYIEYRTAGIYHAASSHLQALKARGGRGCCSRPR